MSSPASLNEPERPLDTESQNSTGRSSEEIDDGNIQAAPSRGVFESKDPPHDPQRPNVGVATQSNSLGHETEKYAYLGGEDVSENPRQPDAQPDAGNVTAESFSTGQKIEEDVRANASLEGSNAPEAPQGEHKSGSLDATVREVRNAPLRGGIRLQKRFGQFTSVLGLFLVSFVCVMATTCFAFLSAASPPRFYIPNSAVLIVALQAATAFCVFLLGEIVTDMFELFRWHCAAGPNGVGMAKFFGLGRATNLWGVFRLMLSNQKAGHQQWCILRLLFVASRLVLTFIFFINIDFQTVYRRATPDTSIVAGSAPFNVTYSTGIAEQVMLLSYFSMYLESLLSDPLIAIGASPTTEACQMAGSECYTYVLPGEFVLIAEYIGNPVNFTDLLSLPHGNANAFTAESASVYQLEFFPPDNSTVFTDDDCGAYGNPSVGDDLIAGWLACPYNVTVDFGCFSGPAAWNYTLTRTVQLHISNYLADIVYSIPDGEIQSVSPLSDPIPSFYSAIDLLEVYSIAFNVTLTSSANLFQALTEIPTTLFLYVVGMIDATSGAGRQTGVETAAFQNLLALPLYAVNYNKLREYGDPLPPDLQYLITSGYFANSLYRIVIANWTLYVFTIISTCTLVWCAAMLVYCWVAKVVMPNTSDYPEFDFASKCLANNGEHCEEDGGLRTIFDGFGNADTANIVEQIKARRLFVGARTLGPSERVVIVADNPLRELEAGKKYL